MMKNICDKIHEKDEKFSLFKDGFDKCYTALKCKIEDIDKDSLKARKELANNT
jgi:hypothetical protein